MGLAEQIKPDDWRSVRSAIRKLNTKLGPVSTPTFAGLTLTNLTVSGTLTVGNFGTLLSEVNSDNENAIRLKGTDTSVDVVIGSAGGFFNVYNAADDESVFFVEGDTGDANIAGDCDVKGDTNVAGIVVAASFITGGDIGIVADTDLLQLADGALTVNGALGVGVAPAVRLHIQTVDCEETSITASSTNTAIRIHDSVATGIGPRWGISWMGKTNRLLAAIEPDVVSEWDTHLNFYTRQGGTLVNALHLDESGNVGIGTVVPGAKLEVSGGEIWMFNDGGSPRFVIGDTSAAGNYGYMQWDSADGYMDYGATTAHRFNNPIEVPKISNTSGDLKIMPDVQGDIVLFGDTDVTDNETDGRALYVYRRAAEFDKYVKMFVDKAGTAMFNTDSSNFQFWSGGGLRFNVQSTGVTFYPDLRLRYDNKYLYFGSSKDARIYYDGADFIIDPDNVGSGVVKIGATADDNIDAAAYLASGTQVVSSQGVAVADATDAADVILRLNDLLARVRAHGLIAT